MEIQTIILYSTLGKQLQAIQPRFPYNGLISISIAKVTHMEHKVVFVHLTDQVFGGIQWWLLKFQNLAAVIKFTMT